MIPKVKEQCKTPTSSTGCARCRVGFLCCTTPQICNVPSRREECALCQIVLSMYGVHASVFGSLFNSVVSKLRRSPVAWLAVGLPTSSVHTHPFLCHTHSLTHTFIHPSHYYHSISSFSSILARVCGPHYYYYSSSSSWQPPVGANTNIRWVSCSCSIIHCVTCSGDAQEQLLLLFELDDDTMDTRQCSRGRIPAW